VLDFDGSRRVRRRDLVISGVVILLGLALFALPPAHQQPIRETIRGTVMSPFLAGQVQIAERRARLSDITVIRSQRDSLAALAAAQATLAEENRRLRSLLGLAGRAGDDFVPTNLLRLGVGAAESTFMISAGSDQGVRPGSPVIAPDGLLGMVREVESNRAHALDWTHPDFRVSAMTAEGDAYGIVEPRRGRYREEDLLALTGAPFHADIQPGRRIVTSGRGGVYPRGILVGTVIGIEEADTGWRKSYLIRPAVRPEAVSQVLVGTRPGGFSDLSELWHVTAPPDTLVGGFAGDTIVARAAAPRPAVGIR
jgi:rod shape-determining protein MreC